MTSMTRGPLPPAVYWRRRILVLGLAVALVMVIGRVLGGGSDGSSDDDPGGVAEQVAGTPTDSPSDDPTRKQGGKKNKPTTPPTPTSTPLPSPTGDCEEDDILIEPVVDQAVAGSDVMIVLELRTRTTEACTWSVSPGRLALKVTSGSDDIWASRECPRAIPVKDVVVRQDHTSRLGVIWDARRSDDGCTRWRDWVTAGYYHVAVAPMGGEPVDVQFRLAAPTAEVITQSPDPVPGGGSKSKSPDQDSDN
ncbi:MAG: hypothetical protein M3237_22155 [Actinomycetota bacterium]|nr:hypothetical protein [Actinomycetota bacterium]